MSRLPAFLALALLAFAAGVFVQHRWPLGTWRARWADRPSPAAVDLQSVVRLAPARRLVLLVLGQSNAANYGSTRAQAGAGVYVFAGGRLYAARDPLPGGDGRGGSVWTRLGARLRADGRYDAVVFALAARGSSRAADFVPGGACHGLLRSALADLAAAGLAPDAVLWQQGETEGLANDTSTAAYAASLASVQRECAATFPHAVFLVALASRHGDSLPHAGIRLAQSRAATAPGAAAGPDLDALNAAWRGDGVHFNERGLDACAALWEQSLGAALAAQSGGTAR